MKQIMTKIMALTLAPVFAAALFSGCGGGGGGGGGQTGRINSNLALRVDLQPIAGKITGGTLPVDISVLNYSETGASTAVVSMQMSIIQDADGKYRGTALLTNIPPGVENLFCRVTIQTSGAARAAGRAAGAGAESNAYMGAIIDNPLTSETTTDVGIDAVSTVKAITTLYYAYYNSAAPMKITNELKANVSSAVKSDLESGAVDPLNFILGSNTGSDPFIPSAWTYAFTRNAQGIIARSNVLGKDDLMMPWIAEYTPKNGDTIPCNQPKLKIIFSESMDTGVNLNDPAVLRTSGFDVLMQRQDNGHRQTLNSDNALNYGSFGWETTNEANDTLALQIKDNTTLGRSGLAWLGCGYVYDILSRNINPVFKDLKGNGVDTRMNFPTTASVTTAQK